MNTIDVQTLKGKSREIAAMIERKRLNIDKDLGTNILNIERISERTILMKLCINSVVLNIANIYAPMEV